MECAVQMPEIERYVATGSGPGSIRAPFQASHDDDDASDEISDTSSNEGLTEDKVTEASSSV